MIGDFVFKLKYARYNEAEKRRETWTEAVDRYLETHVRYYGTDAQQALEELREPLINKQILPSMRGLQFGGRGILNKHMRLYNCTCSYADRPRFFAEALWLLLCGSGVGFSVQRHHVASLPSIIAPTRKAVHIVADSIEGWAGAVEQIINAYMYSTPEPIYDYSQIRPEGSPLSVGGVAPGPEPLKEAIEGVREILKGAVGRQLTPIEVFDMTMYLADSTRTAGTRRSATIALFSADDQEMMQAKTGDWYLTHPKRARANISAVVTKDTPQETFSELIKSTREYGEPGFVFLESTEHNVNPCVEIIMAPVLITDAEGRPVERYSLELLDPEKRDQWRDQGYTFQSGWQACNLTTVNVSACESSEDLIEASRRAAVLGTLQAGYTHTDYLGEVSRRILEREALLGVSLCGVMDKPHLMTNGDLEDAASAAVKANEETAKLIGIKQAARVTCVKPEGTASLVLGSSSGIHPAHAKRYLRRIQCSELEPVFRHFRDTNPQAVEPSAWGSDYCAVFPMQAPEGALTKNDLTALEMLEQARRVKRHYVNTGTARPESLEGATHNVSLTVTVDSDEWAEVESYLWKHRADFTGVSLLASSGDYDYQQAPLQAVSPDMEGDQQREAWRLWQELSATMEPVKYDDLSEETDQTRPLETVVCSGGECVLK
jgi:ribonucleoside-diphosphate reductase alpha chain